MDSALFTESKRQIRTTSVRVAAGETPARENASGEAVRMEAPVRKAETVSVLRDLTGRRFGRLVCLEPTNQRDSSGAVMWRCQCDCGKECLAVSKKLRQGAKKSCGCLRAQEIKEYIGKQFGELVVVDYAGRTGGMHRWKCRCSCGRETIVGQTLLQSGKTKSCGHLQKTVIRENLKLCDGTSVTMLQASKKHRIKSNTSGYTGVYQNKKTGCWIAQITFKGNTYYLGSYENIQDAVQARKRGEEMHNEFLDQYQDHPDKLRRHHSHL